MTGSFPDVGAVYAGKYRLERVMSDTPVIRLYEAREIGVERRVALKVVLPASATNPTEFGQRFSREAAALALLQSTSSIKLYDHGQVGRTLYLAFEYLEGPTLSELLSSGAIAPGAVLEITCEILRVLGELHAAGIIHRDIKPSNIMFASPDEIESVKLLDFAIAKSWTHTSAGEPLLGDLTGKGRMMGTPRYMSPEQVVGRRVVPQSDLYSLGLVILEMLTGKPANPGDDVVIVIQRHLSEEPFPIPPGLPSLLEDALRRMLAKPIDQRPASSTEVLALLAPLRATSDAVRDDETIPLPEGLVSAAQDIETDPNVPILAVPGEDPTLPTDAVASIVNAAVAQDETVKFDTVLHSEPPAPAPAPAPVPGPAPPPEKRAVVGGADWGELDEGLGRVVMTQTTDTLTFEFPAKMELKHGVEMAIAGIVTFVISILATPLIAPIGLAIILVIWLSTRVSRRLEFGPERWSLRLILWRFKREQGGPIGEVQALGAAEQRIEMVTNAGTFLVASDFSHSESVSTSQISNDWLRR